MWLSLVEHYVRDVGVACSNQVIPTKKALILRAFFVGLPRNVPVGLGLSPNSFCTEGAENPVSEGMPLGKAAANQVYKR